MEVTIDDLDLFDHEFFAFKQLKERYTVEEVEEIKRQYKDHWQKWKRLQQTVASTLPESFHMEKPKIESWTNGWNLRNHFWSAYRDPNHPHQNACLAVLLNKKQFQVYLMFQHYKSDERSGSLAAYNQLLTTLGQWSKGIDIKDYYIWPQVEHELDDHLPLSAFLSDDMQPEKLMRAMQGRTFQLGKLFFKTTTIPNIVETTAQALEELAPLYFALT
ncbi:HI_0552 family protein [Enterococcus sp. DIV0756]|uniref:HI_0552 family protein n=1 Tax=Enterococcus sp. DIV0756 TaxID=2774636 RepID=UPI003F2667D8